MNGRGNIWLLLSAVLLAQICNSDKGSDSASLPVEHRGGSFNLPLAPLASNTNKRQILAPNGGNYGAGGPVPVPVGPGPIGGVPGAQDDPWPISNGGDQPKIKNLQVQCEKTHMRVNIEFDRPFYGMIFSKGHYSDPNCVHVRPGSGQLSATFDVYLNSCGMTSSGNTAVGGGFGQPSPSGTFVENTIIIQYDPLVQEVWDQARRLRCTWYDYYEKSVTFRPFAVDMINAVTANFLGDNLQCWMQIQVGKGPWASEVSGIVKIGQTMTMVLAIKDEENKFDMLVRNCVAHDGVRAPIQLVDQFGCVSRPKIMSRFQKVRNFGQSASVVSYAYFQAFKFPDSMNVHFQCVIQVCRNSCPEPTCEPAKSGARPDLSYAASANSAVVSNNGIDPRVPSSINSGARAPQQGYTSVKREGIAAADQDLDQEPVKEKERLYLGRPRMVDIDANATSRARRDVLEMTDVSTTRLIQVVAPGDVAFTLNPNQNETVVVQNLRDLDANSICLSVPSFVGGLTMLLLVLIIACMVSVFLLLRVRQFDANKKVSTTNSMASLAHVANAYDHPEFVKISK